MAAPNTPECEIVAVDGLNDEDIGGDPDVDYCAMYHAAMDVLYDATDDFYDTGLRIFDTSAEVSAAMNEKHEKLKEATTRLLDCAKLFLRERVNDEKRSEKAVAEEKEERKSAKRKAAELDGKPAKKQKKAL